MYCVFHPFKTCGILKQNNRLWKDINSLIDKECTVSDILIRNGNVTVESSTNIVKFLVLSFKKLIDSYTDAVNYLEMKLHCGTDPDLSHANDFIVTIQRAEKPTPAELHNEAKVEIARLRGILEAHSIDCN